MVCLVKQVCLDLQWTHYKLFWGPFLYSIDYVLVFDGLCFCVRLIMFLYSIDYVLKIIITKHSANISATLVEH